MYCIQYKVKSLHFWRKYKTDQYKNKFIFTVVLTMACYCAVDAYMCDV